jgi:hypothetical protein
MKRLVMMMLCAGLCLAGCGKDDAEDTDMASVDMAPGADMAPGTDMSEMVYNPPATYATRYQLRFETLLFSFPQTLKGLNGVLGKNFDQSTMFPVIILVEIKDVKTDAGTMKLRGGAGIKGASAGIYQWDPDNGEMYFDGAIDPATGKVTGTIEKFKFVATFESEEPSMPLRSTIPINRLDFEGYLEDAPEGGGKAVIKIGKLNGNITLEQARATDITILAGNPPVKLSVLLKEERMDLDLDGDGTKDAWNIRDATFTAVPVTIQ